MTDYIKQSSSSEANRFSASQEIPHIVWHLKVQYRIRKSKPSVPIQSQINPLNACVLPKNQFKALWNDS